MAIQFARIEIVGRSGGGNACCKGAYNARSYVTDQKTNVTYNFKNKGDNVYHEVMVPEHADKKFKNVSEFLNEVERCEKRKDSQLLKDVVLALPDDKELDLKDRIEITHRLIEKRGWVKEGLGVQVDIHEPHDGEKNWHAHLLVTTRRFKEDGLGLGAKATDLNPAFGKSNGKAYVKPEGEQIHEELRDVVNNYFAEKGLDNRVDSISLTPQEHVGPVRMRAAMNAAVERNDARIEAERGYISNGEGLLNKVTAHMSMFTRGDLYRATKYIEDQGVREKLVEDALSQKNIVQLHKESGEKLEIYTTKQVRKEEEKVLRMSGYVANIGNAASRKVSLAVKDGSVDIPSLSEGMSDEQETALTGLVSGNSGLQIVRGRAGVGKSFVLGRLNSIYELSGVNVIGLAPTHRAKQELADIGIDRVDTVKGMLFRLANGRFELPKKSVIILDEAGMVGNDDYTELLRVAATRKCNVILSGDERQLASVQRGGMFEVMTKEYGSRDILDIKRQDLSWGREVASSMSKGEVGRAVSILSNEKQIKWSGTSDEAMINLIKDWQSSKFEYENRLVLAVRNKDVVAINAGIREYLKDSGQLNGREIEVAGNRYMKGDRVLIAKSNKQLGLVSGDLVKVASVSNNEFVFEKGKEQIKFDPAEYGGFKHGYASTVFKAQGASIKDVYMYHGGFAGVRNSYVALSRHIVSLGVYVGRDVAYDKGELARQLSHKVADGSSMEYFTEKEIESKNLDKKLSDNKNVWVRSLVRSIDFVETAITKLVDKLPTKEYYNYVAPEEKREKVSEVLHNTYQEEEKMVVNSRNIDSLGEDIVDNSLNTEGDRVIVSAENDNNSSNIKSELKVSDISGKIQLSAKERFYAHADRVRSHASYVARKEQWEQEYQQLKSEIKFKAEYIARDLLGDPNKRLSSRGELRFGEHGKLALRITGEKAGTWYDFSKGEGGDMFALAKSVRGGEFKEVAEYLRSQVGMDSAEGDKSSNLKLAYTHQSTDRIKDQLASAREQDRKEKVRTEYVDRLYGRSKEIVGTSIASRYLSRERGISVELSDDIRTAGVYVKEKEKHLPSMIAFARDSDGKITGGQQIILSGSGARKADIDVPKKSFGKISGSFVDLGKVEGRQLEQEQKKEESITVISEGVETGLSVKQAMQGEKVAVDTKHLCSLGIGNIKNYEPQAGEKIIIAADNDGKNDITAKTIEGAKSELEEKGAFVEVVRPSVEGDFNDVLKENGEKEIASSFEPVIAKHTATSLREYVQAGGTDVASRLNEDEIVVLEKVERCGIDQSSLVDSFRTSYLKGHLAIDGMRKDIEVTQRLVHEQKNNIELAKEYGAELDQDKLLGSVINESRDGREGSESNKTLSSALVEKQVVNSGLVSFAAQKEQTSSVDSLYNVLLAEQEFLSRIGESDKEGTNNSLLANIKANLLANHKQGALPIGDLKELVISHGIDLKSLDVSLDQVVVNNRDKYLGVMNLELASLVKLKIPYDRDKLVGEVKGMSSQERWDYGQKLLGKEAKPYIEPTFLKYDQERANSKDFNEFLDIVAKEQKTYRELYQEHLFAVNGIDKYNGDSKHFMSIRNAKMLGEFGTKEVIERMRFVVDHKLMSEDDIKKQITEKGGSLRDIASITRVKYRDYTEGLQKEQEQQKQLERQQEAEQQKQQEQFQRTRDKGGFSL